MEKKNLPNDSTFIYHSENLHNFIDYSKYVIAQINFSSYHITTIKMEKEAKLKKMMFSIGNAKYFQDLSDHGFSQLPLSKNYNLP